MDFSSGSCYLLVSTRYNWQCSFYGTKKAEMARKTGGDGGETGNAGYVFIKIQLQGNISRSWYRQRA